MDGFAAVRRLARERRTSMKGDAAGASTAVALLAKARAATGTTVERMPPEHPLLGGGDGALHRSGDKPAIYVSAALEPDIAAYVEAHEFGHLWIETPTEPAVVSRGSDPGSPEENSPTGIRRVEAYSPDELRERYANVFAREFLLTFGEARRLFLSGLSAGRIAADLGIPLGLVNQQLAAALLLPEVPERETGPIEKLDLDPSQKDAAEHEGSALLVEAGPGTGKTRTLVGRIEHLLANGVPPAGILVLTFSNKAAGEIKRRVAQTAPQASAEIWAGTFHGFGLEFLRRCGHLDGIKEPVQLLDQADQLRFLEEDLPKLGLDHYLYLHEPAFGLRHILGAISRAKDEMFGADRYAEAAERMRGTAGADAEALLRASKAAEVAAVYQHYDARLRAEGVVDFADLINRPIEILRKNPVLRDEMRGQYVHILVDEYQDVNRASALLLKELAGEGRNLWVVGDARQSIYRFRGAAPSNIAKFAQDFPGARTKQLAVNYRSRPEIVVAFATYADQMSLGRGRDNSLDPDRGPGNNPIDFNVADERAAEIEGLAAAVARFRAEGIAFKNQAILCRGHSYLQQIATGLEAAGIPVLNLGDLFERSEVRDLLSFVSFVSEPHRAGLMRLATMPRYRMPLADVRAFLAAAVEMEKTPWSALKGAEKIAGLSVAAKAALARLRADLDGVGFKTGPGRMLFDVLFEKGLVRDYLQGDAPADLQRRLAIHQILQFAAENDAGEGDPKRAMLEWIRRLAVFGDDRSLRDLPAAVEGIDAVRLMTVHGSKGLEFDVVHLPGLGNGMFPFSGGGSPCPPPDGMLDIAAAVSKAEEEECLFFVALSRARDRLSLSRAAKYGARTSHASPAVKAIASHLPRAYDAVPSWTGRTPAREMERERADLRGTAKEHEAHDIDIYDNCPRRYLYQIVLGLSRSRQDNGFVHFHRTVYRVLRWLAQQGGQADAAAIKVEFDRQWAETGPAGSPLEPLYLENARRMLDREVGRPREGIRSGEVASLAVDGHTVRVEIDEIEQTGRKLTVRRIRTGRPGSKKEQGLVHALMLKAAEGTFGGTGQFVVRYLSGEDADVPVKLDGVMKSRLADAGAAIAGISRGQYPATPGEDCPRCPHYFICGAVPD